MAIAFQSPSYRAAGSDLTVAISPLGLVELADEEFEVHGPRLNRYASNWAWYLGHHWSHKRETGELNITLNYTRALSDFITNFCFGKGVEFKSAPQYSAILPRFLDEVWTQDNPKELTLWEMGQAGGVSGDCFVKVAYEEPFVDPVGIPHNGKIRIIPLNAAHSFPEFHPHDRTRMIRFKLKYRFWACVDSKTEALTRNGWKRHDELQNGDEILTLDPVTDEIHWQPMTHLDVHEYDGHMVSWDRLGAVTTPNHRWLIEEQHGREHTIRYERRIARTEFSIDGDPAVSELRQGSRVIVAGGTPMAFRAEQKWADEMVETVAWYVCDGSDHVNQTGFHSVHLSGKKPHKLAAWRRLAAWWSAEGATWNESPKVRGDGQAQFYIGKGVVDALREAAPGKQITPEFVCSLTYAQALLFYNTLIDGDGYRGKSLRWTQIDEGRKDGFQMLCAMLGKRTSKTSCGQKVQEHTKARHLSPHNIRPRRVHSEDRMVWCPTVESGIWMARREGHTFWTGNTSLEGTRSVYTFTELITDSMIEQYVNDELVDSYPNVLGMIPIVHIPNTTILSSPWGQSDIQDIIPLNRELNEKMTEVSDIINYHAAPVTIITGAKASQLERGPKKVWAGLPKDANVFNLESKGEMSSAIEYVIMVKRAMHEMTGVPETALGQVQPISNTSGVALAITYQPLMNRYSLKKITYTLGLQRINALVIRTASVFAPDRLVYDPSTSAPLEEGQADVVDITDPKAMITDIYWPPPLPVDLLVKLNEVQTKMALGLESKQGALADLGEQFPQEKLLEIFDQMKQDALDQGALDMIRAQISQAVMLMTGFVPESEGSPSVADSSTSDVASGTPGPPQTGPLPGTAIDPMIEEDLMNQLVQKAYGTKFAQRRVPET